MEITKFIIVILSFIVSVLAFIFSFRSNMKANKYVKINTELAKQNSKLAHGTIELEIRSMISESRRYLLNILVELKPLLNKKDIGTISEEEIGKCAVYEKQYKIAQEDLLNTYEEACSKYRDSKIDKDRFKKLYIKEIRNLVENTELRGQFDSISSPYRAIKKVYEEWENIEK